MAVPKKKTSKKIRNIRISLNGVKAQKYIFKGQLHLNFGKNLLKFRYI